MKTLSLALVVLSLSALLAGCGAGADSVSANQQAAGTAGTAGTSFGPGSECGALETGLYESVTYGIYNDLETKCQALGGQCLPLAGSGMTAGTDKVFCVVPAP